MFDEWYEQDKHHIEMFAIYPSNSALGYKMAFLYFSQVLNEQRLDGEDHVTFTNTVLSWIHKDCSGIVSIIRDNCNTNKAICDKLNLPLIGCASHRFNFAVQDIMKSYQSKGPKHYEETYDIK